MTSKRVKYGKVLCGPIQWFGITAAQNFEQRSGHFVKLASGLLTIAGSGDTELIGWALIGDVTASSTAGQDKCPVDMSLESVWEIPTDAVFTAAEALAFIGDTCDLITTSNIQMADIGEATEEVIQIIGYNVDRQTVYVRLNPNKIAGTTVV